MRTPEQNRSAGLPKEVVYSFREMNAPWALRPWERAFFMQEFIEANIVDIVDDPVYFSDRIDYYLGIRLCSLPWYPAHYH